MSFFLRRSELRRATARLEREVAVDSDELDVAVVPLIAETLERPARGDDGRHISPSAVG